jgi:CheY-like chemotaxis protein
MRANPRRQRKALLLHGDAGSTRLLGEALQQRGFEVLAAADGERGLARLTDELLDLDVLVLDVDLPGRDGWSLLRLVRAAGGERDLRIVMTGRGLDVARREQLRWLGADAVVDLDDGAASVADAARVRRVAAPRRCALSGRSDRSYHPFTTWSHSAG